MIMMSCFDRLFEWIPPKIIPNEITSEQFKKLF